MEIDLRKIPSEYRDKTVLDVFQKLKEGEELKIIVDHHPSDIIQLLNGKIQSYEINKNDKDFVLRIVKSKEISQTDFIVSHISKYRKIGDTFTPVPVLRKDEYGAVLVFLRPSQYIPEHAPDSDLIFYVINGKGKAIIDKKEFEIKEGSIVIVPKGVKRGFKADTYMEALHIVIPAPSPEDHEKIMKAVREGLEEVDLKRQH